MRVENGFTFFWAGEFSNWFPAKFHAQGHTFENSEQYFMYRKAQFFGDLEIAEQILITPNPKKVKALGRKVKGYNEKMWRIVRKDMMTEACTYKYLQNPKLADCLIDTDGTTLVEASPVDTIWGIGLGENDDRVLNKEKWRGLNLLGEVLTELRDEIIRREEW